MDYDLPEELQGYLPKERQGFQLMNEPNYPPQRGLINKRTRAPNITVPKAQHPNPRKPVRVQQKVTQNPVTRRVQNQPAKRVQNQPAKRVQAVYPKKGKLLSKVPENKWKDVKAGPREDTTIVRTEEEEVQIFLKYTNDFRQKNNLCTLELNDDLSKIASEHNHNMMDGKTKVGHEGFKDRTKLIQGRFKRASENCAMYVGPREHLLTLFENLVNSPSHCKNLLGDFNTIGISIGKNPENMWYVTQFFVYFL